MGERGLFGWPEENSRTHGMDGMGGPRDGAGNGIELRAMSVWYARVLGEETLEHPRTDLIFRFAKANGEGVRGCWGRGGDT